MWLRLGSRRAGSVQRAGLLAGGARTAEALRAGRARVRARGEEAAGLLGEAAEGEALTIAEVLRNHGWVVDLGYSGNVARRMRRANNVNARAAVLIGEEEIARNVVALRDLDSGEQMELPMEPSLSELRACLQALYC